MLWKKLGKSFKHHFGPRIPSLTFQRVPNRYDEYTGYPHWFWAFPSKYLAEPIATFDRNLAKGFDFVLSGSGSKI
jgi:hypothetical protein